VTAWKPIVAALLIFAAGVVTGGLTVNLRQPSPPRSSGVPVKKVAPLPREAQLRELSRRMQNELDLTPAQRDRVEAIIHGSQDRMKTVWDQVGPKIREEFREMRQKIRGELTPVQRKRFEEIMKQHDERNRRDANPRSTPPPAEKPQ
jgi:Spy/CpxP family protein refolding chaperone